AFQSADLWIMVDTAAVAQVEPVAPLLANRRARLLIIDHHRTRDIVADAEIIDDSAAAAALVIADFADAAPWKISSVAAELIFVGLATDTGWFRFANADARALACASRLLEQGVPAAELSQKIFQSDPVERFRLFAAVNQRLAVAGNGRIGVLEVTRELM